MSFINDNALDETLNYIQNNAEEYHLQDGEPGDFGDVSGNDLGSVPVDSSDFSIGADGEDRELVIDGQDDIDSDGDATHIAIVDNASS